MLINPDNLREDLAKKISEIYEKKLSEMDLDKAVDESIKQAIDGHVKKSLDIRKIERKIRYELGKIANQIITSDMFKDIKMPDTNSDDVKARVAQALKKQVDDTIKYQVDSKINSWWYNHGRQLIDKTIEDIVTNKIIIEQGAVQVSGTVTTDNT